MKHSPLTLVTAQEYTRWGLPEGATLRLGKGRAHACQYSPDGTRLAVTSTIGIWLYDAQTSQEVALFTGHTADVKSIAFSPDGQTLASGSKDEICLWDVAAGMLKHTLTEHTSSVESVAFGAAGQTLASGSWDGTVLLWDIAQLGSER